ncbi:MAG: siderophore-interacting protein [Rhizobiales bacterium]|nr:siderophore-interacting protein [Hyphomicrobiales bacterium]
MPEQPETGKARTPTRIRHEIRVRTLDVLEVRRLTPSMIRVTLGGSQLEGFTSLGFDDHIKMFFPDPGDNVPRLPIVGPQGLEMPEGQARPVARDYTVRAHDAERRRLDIDFAVHESGPATAWAITVRPGDKAWIAGPRGSFVFPLAFDWHLLVGDETALPAISRRIEELPSGTKAVAVIEVAGKESELPLATSADIRIVWAHCEGAQPGSPEPLAKALAEVEWLEGDFHVWLGCGSGVARQLRQWLIDERGANPKWLRASGYWRHGESGYHDHYD